ncbi:MAG: LpqB family beta-propeller domain-containing protein [Actinomycetota bacterium]
MTEPAAAPVRPRGRRHLLPAALVGLAAALACGCATVPTSGQALPVAQPKNGTNQGADFPQLIPAPPGKDWSPVQIVSGFLAASASFAGNHSVARQYLVPGKAQSWRPGWAVSVVSQPVIQRVNNAPPRALGASADSVAGVSVSGQELASLNASGQYQTPNPSASAKTIVFKLVKVRGQWRIVDPPRRLLLSNSEFHRVYQSRDLYYYGTGSDVLVPDPVFVPLQAATKDLATGLVTALEQEPVGWLQGATETRFPPGTKLISLVPEGSEAVVNLGGPVAKADPATIRDMAGQLVWTLMPPRSAITSIRFEVNGVPVAGSLGGVELRKKFDGVPTIPSNAPLYFVGKNGTVQRLPASGAAQPAAVPGPAGTGAFPMNTVSVTPDSAPQQAVAGISTNGRLVYYGPFTRGAKLRSWRPGGMATSLSWDRYGDLWVATSKGIWLLRPGRQVPIAVDDNLASNQRVTALRVAPDGVRLAMIVHDSKGSQVMIAAISYHLTSASMGPSVRIGASVVDPAALSWYDADDLAVLSQPGAVGAEIEQVPVNGGPVALIGAEPRAISLATAGPQIVAGLPGGRLVIFTASTASWRPLPPGQNPVYPG